MSAAQAKAWQTRRQKMRGAHYGCPNCSKRFTWQCLVNGPYVPSHTAPGHAGECSGTGKVLVRPR